jgi:DNA repair exonuclease SbcCD ATPase subunit
MSTARVTSVEAIRDFRGSYLVYCDEAKQALEAADGEARRMKDWISYQAQVWKKAIRECEEKLSQAKNALFRKELQKTAAGRTPDVIEEKKAVARAKEALEHAHKKLANCKRWEVEFDKAIGEYEGPARQLAGEVEGEPPKAVSHLDRILDSLDAYTQLAPVRTTIPDEKPSAKEAAPSFAARGVEVEQPANSTPDTPAAEETSQAGEKKKEDSPEAEEAK